jgi:hypothetical protein
MTQANNPHPTTEPLGSNFATIVPKNPLKLSTVYNIHVEYTNNGKPFVLDRQMLTESYDINVTDTTGQ